jgi:hypothetical protein
MDPLWESEFRARMKSFKLQRSPCEGEVPISIKVRITSGCFHREHSPHAYQIIDKHLASIIPSQRSELAFVEHESGPELLVYLALATAGVTLAKSVIDLIVAIIKARAEGIKRGDHPNDAIELIVRRIGEGDKFAEETVLRIDHNDRINRTAIEAGIQDAFERLTSAKAKTINKRLKNPRRPAPRKLDK